MLAVVALPVKSIAGQTELRGLVRDSAGVPIAGATVTLTNIRYSVKTDSLGRFQFAGTPGSTLTLSLQAAGFRDEKVDVVLPRGRTFARDFVLVSEATPLPEVNPSDRVLRVRATTTDGESIAYANLQVNGSRRYVSDDSGRFTVPIMLSGRSSLLLRRIGFEPTEMILMEMPDTAVRVPMRAVARTLETQVVTVRSPYARLDLSGFYKRMADVERGARVGYFVTPEDLALRNPQNVTDAVEQFPNIRLRPIDDGRPGALDQGVPLARKFRIEDRNGCPLTVYLDRVRVQPSIVGQKGVDEQINTLVQPHAVAGIEVYPRAAGAPPEYPPVVMGGLHTCGVVLIWTK
jgi:hypothetical protein